MKAMIFAAGFGTRLWPLTLNRAKPAVPFLNLPLICHSVKYLTQLGVNEIIVNLHHKPESIQQAIGDVTSPDLKIQYSWEPTILGTGGGLDKARSLLSDSGFIAINGKILTQINLIPILEFHKREGALATLVLRPNQTGERFSEVKIDEVGRILKFDTYPPIGGTLNPTPLMFTGIQILEPRIFDYIPRGRFSHTTSDVYPQAIQAGEKIMAQVATEPWYEFSTLERYLDIHVEWLKKQDRPFSIGKNGMIEAGANITHSVLWDDVKVHARAALHRCIVGDRVSIPSGSNFTEVAIVRRELAEHSERGDVMGDNLVVPIAVRSESLSTQR